MTYRPQRPVLNEAGFVVPSTIMVLTILLLIMMAVAGLTRLDIKATAYSRDRTQAEYGALAGLEFAQTQLAMIDENFFDYTLLSGLDPEAPERSDGMVELSGAGLDLGNNSVRIWLQDESAKLDLNLATGEEFQGLAELSQEQIDSLLDWRDIDNTPGENGAESDWYQEQRGYPAKNEPFDTVSELGLVKGFSKQGFQGTTGSIPLDRYFSVWTRSPDFDPQGRAKIVINRSNLSQLKARLPSLTDQDIQAIDRGLQKQAITQLKQLFQLEGLSREKAGMVVDYVTVGNRTQLRGRVNVNTATAPVLAALPGCNDTTAQLIVAARDSEGPFRQLSSFIQHLAEIAPEAVPLVVDRVTVNSGGFNVRVESMVHRTKITITAIVDIQDHQAKVIYISQTDSTADQ